MVHSSVPPVMKVRYMSCLCTLVSAVELESGEIEGKDDVRLGPVCHASP